MEQFRRTPCAFELGKDERIEFQGDGRFWRESGVAFRFSVPYRFQQGFTIRIRKFAFENVDDCVRKRGGIRESLVSTGKFRSGNRVEIKKSKFRKRDAFGIRLFSTGILGITITHTLTKQLKYVYDINDALALSRKCIDVGSTRP